LLYQLRYLGGIFITRKSRANRRSRRRVFWATASTTAQRSLSFEIPRQQTAD